MTSNSENEDDKYSRNLFIGTNIFSFIVGYCFHYIIQNN